MLINIRLASEEIDTAIEEYLKKKGFVLNKPEGSKITYMVDEKQSKMLHVQVNCELNIEQIIQKVVSNLKR